MRAVRRSPDGVLELDRRDDADVRRRRTRVPIVPLATIAAHAAAVDRR